MLPRRSHSKCSHIGLALDWTGPLSQSALPSGSGVKVSSCIWQRSRFSAKTARNILATLKSFNVPWAMRMTSSVDFVYFVYCQLIPLALELRRCVVSYKNGSVHFGIIAFVWCCHCLSTAPQSGTLLVIDKFLQFLWNIYHSPAIIIFLKF